MVAASCCNYSRWTCSIKAAFVRPNEFCSPLSNPTPYNVGTHAALVAVTLIVIPLTLFGLYILPRRIPVVKDMLHSMSHGIILSAGLMHLLFRSFTHFADPCVNYYTTDVREGYAIWSVVVCILTMFLTSLIMSIPMQKTVKENMYDVDATDNDNRVHRVHVVEIATTNTSAAAEFPLIVLGTVIHQIVLGLLLALANNTQYFPSYVVFTVVTLMMEMIPLATRIESRIQLIGTVVLMALSSPVGVGVGMGLREVWARQASTISFGVLEAIAAGILIYVGVASLYARKGIDIKVWGLSLVATMIMMVLAFLTV